MEKSKLNNFSDYQLSCCNSDTLNLENINYCIKDLERIVTFSGISLKSIVRNQILTVDFCKEYILNDSNIILDSDENIDVNYILRYQLHLNKSDFNITNQ